MKESKINTLLNQYLRESRMYCYYELKIAKGPSFAFSKIEVNQHESLPALAEEGLVWKLSDEDMRKKPCDGLCTPPLPAYLVILFRDRTLYFIEYEKIAIMRQEGEKSISEDECAAISTRIVHI